jgi:hypothetical protein
MNSHAQVHIDVFNDAGVDFQTVSEGRREATRILGAAKVKLTWSDCRLDACTAGGQSCAEGEHCLQLRLFAAESESAWRVAPDVVAFALTAPAPQFGFFMAVFARRVEDRARLDGISKGRLLGHVIAHETGHLLLGAGAHSKAGVMKFPWTKGDIDKMQTGSLLFLPREVALIRTNIGARLLARR